MNIKYVLYVLICINSYKIFYTDIHIFIANILQDLDVINFLI